MVVRDKGPASLAAARRVVQLVERFYFRPGDFPKEPLESVLAVLQADMRDKTAELQQRRDAKAAAAASMGGK